MFALEATLGSITLFARLRPDEMARVAARFTLVHLAPSKQALFGPAPADLRLAVVISGSVDLTVDLPGGGTLRARLEPGDRAGELALFTGHARPARLEAHTASTVALLDRPGLDAILAEFPAVALPLVEELARELARGNDMARQLGELHAASLHPAELDEAIAAQRRALVRRGARVSRLGPRALFHVLVPRGGEPPFWMLTGFLVSLVLARLVVGAILHFGLEHRLFALVPGHDPNPMHVHHFNYGLVLVGVSGLAALFPLGRKALRALAFLFGLGCGLVFDEFALFWNLNPEYAQRLSLVAAALMAAVLAQAVYFRRFWRALLRRGFLLARGAR